MTKLNLLNKHKRFVQMPLYVLFIISILFLSWEAHIFYPYYAGASALSMPAMSDEQAVPEESIRLRIKSNSNSPVDQQVKINIRNEVNRQISQWTGNLTSLEDAREEIESRMPALEQIVSDELEKVGKKTSFRVSLDDTDFPTKQYGNRVYPEGEYEAVFIELGDGLGDNWWCVLFPPLCFVDVADKDEEKTAYAADDVEDEEEVEVSFFVVDVVKSLWAKIT
ncbi:stage II sporulation protein R [Salipaludibacillus daqingensis]|uniref:stage II sporulation protein R n=1 Tax=Salipaludibacillus daqingensis TaxID=3041001 RepID=UPI002476A01B|nr:stage II sporulation protein R [Salipaludibacillus daqingensis]